MRQQNLRGLPLSRTPPMVAVKINGVLVAEAKSRTLFKDPLSATVKSNRKYSLTDQRFVSF
jgi:hypothetical protein